MANSVNDYFRKSRFTAPYYSSGLIVVLLSVVTLSFAWNYHREHDYTLSLAKKEALTNFNKDVALRFWISEHGGVYVPVSEQTPPNQYLSHILERDIVTPAGKKLTLMNPAYMIRQVMEGYDKLYGVKGHITSLKLLNPENKPDNWEQLVLRNFEKGMTEVFEVTTLSGKPYLRLMRPFFVKKECLKCHKQQDYEVGDVRGGIGISVPLSYYYEMEQKTIYRMIIYHSLFGLLGSLTIVTITFQRAKRQIANKLAEEALRKSEELYRSFVKGTDNLVTQVDKDGNLTFVNYVGEIIFGISTDKLQGMSAFQFIHPDDCEKTQKWFEECVKNRLPKSYFENRQVNKKTGEVSYMLWTNHFVYDEKKEVIGINGIAHNITERIKAEEQVKASLKEKETLLQEIHHRVKNNLTVVASLLNLQANSMEDDRLKAALSDSQSRVQAMSAIHETLYQSENLSAIDMKIYLSKLGNNIARNSSIGSKVNLKVKSENISIGAKQASPIGLIVNELITNSLKYAFSNNEDGEIKINLQKVEDQIELEYSDNGIGIPDGFDWKNASTLGLKLVRTLVENQLDGSIDLGFGNK